MTERPNLDYEPCPEGVSYSRVGPPMEPPRTGTSSPRYELATEISLAGGGALPKRRIRRIRAK